MNLLTTIRRAPKQAAVFAAFAVAMTGTAFTLAWGPDRPAFTVENPADYVTFNSITNNPVDGNEFNFVRIKGDGVPLSDNVTAQEGKEYTVRILVHNNAGENLDLESVNTIVKAAVPTTTGKELKITGFVSADNAKPKQVWDEASLKSDRDFNVAYVPGSAKIYNQGYAKGGASLPDSIVTSSGAKVGYEKAADGKIPGCFEYLSYVEFKVKPQFTKTADFTMSKTVRMKGDSTWSESVAAKAGDTVQYRILYRNSGQTQQDNVMVRDNLPAGVSYVPGTTNLFLGSDPNTARKLSDNITGKGVNIGSYAPGAMALIIFDTKVNVNDKLPECGPNTLKNVAKVETDYGTKEDTADVTVTRVCEEKPEEPGTEKVCELKTGDIITIKEDEFDAELHSRTLSDCEDEEEVVETPKEDAPKDAETPQVIAATGPVQIISGLFGSGALGLGIANYIRSRRALSDAL